MVLFNPNRLAALGLLISSALAVLLFVLAGPMAVDANGRVLELKRQMAGPYELAVGTIPSPPLVGAFHMTMNVIDTANNLPIIDADVTVTAMGPVDLEDPASEPVHLGPFNAANSPTDPTFYDVNTVVDREGTWVFTIAVDADLGEGSADFPYEVGRTSPITGIVTLVTLIVFVTILGLSVRAYLRDRSRKRQSRGET